MTVKKIFVFEDINTIYLIVKVDYEEGFYITEFSIDHWERFFKGDREFTEENAEIFINDDGNSTVGYSEGPFDTVEEAEALI